MIPKIIHYCWFGRKRLPRLARKCMDSWRRFCPDYKIIEWNENNFDIDCHPFVRDAYKANAWAFVSDYARLKIIYDNGGIYLDTDVEILKNLDSLLGSHCYVGIGQAGGMCNTGLGFGAEKENQIILDMMLSYESVKFDSNCQRELACPMLNHAVIQHLGYRQSEDVVSLGDVDVYPSKFFDPIAPGKMTKNLLCEDTYSIHHCSNSWGTSEEKLRRKIVGLIGVKRMAMIKELLNGY